MSKPRARTGLAGAALLFAALGDQTRIELLQQLSQRGPASISALAGRFALTRQGVTKHLNVLAAAGLIDGHREGRDHVWVLNTSRFAEAQQHLETIARGWDSALTRLKAHAERP